MVENCFKSNYGMITYLQYRINESPKFNHLSVM